MTTLPVDKSGDHELVALAAELEHYWSEQWRRAKEICDLLEQRLAAGAAVKPQLRLVSAPPPTRATERRNPAESAPPPLKIVDT